jgi:hypothetical protein
MAYKAVLKVDGEQRTLLTYHYHLFDMWTGDILKVSDTRRTLYDFMAVAEASPYAFRRHEGEEPFGGLFDFSMESTGDDDFLYHWFIPNYREGYTRLNHGIIELYDGNDEYMPMKRIEFWDAWITEISEHFASVESSPMRISFTMSPATIRVNKEFVFRKCWWQTDINEKEVQQQEEAELFVSDVKWRVKKGNYVSPAYRKDMMLNHSIDLEVITKDFNEGESFELTVKQSNGRRIKGESTEFSVSGSVDADGLATISNFKIECDFKDDNQDFGDIIFYHKNREVARFKENFGWTYIKEGGITKVFVNTEINNTFIPKGCLESDYKEGLNELFATVLEKSSGGIITGKIFFSGTKMDYPPQIVPLLSFNGESYIWGIRQLGSHTTGTVHINADNEELANTFTDVKETGIHELLHTLRIDHPFEITQAKDTELIKVGDEYKTTPNTNKMIHFNIMNYNSTIIDGIRCDSLWYTRRPEYLTNGQLELMIKEIDLQKNGGGTHSDGQRVSKKGNKYSERDYYWEWGIHGEWLDKSKIYDEF